jgi:hypothetical protein
MSLRNVLSLRSANVALGNGHRVVAVRFAIGNIAQVLSV